MSKVTMIRIGNWRWQVHEHDWSPWEETVAVYGNALGMKHDQLVRTRVCTDCKKREVKRLTK